MDPKEGGGGRMPLMHPDLLTPEHEGGGVTGEERGVGGMKLTFSELY